MVFAQVVRSVKSSRTLKDWRREDRGGGWGAIDRAGGRVGRKGEAEAWAGQRAGGPHSVRAGVPPLEGKAEGEDIRGRGPGDNSHTQGDDDAGVWVDPVPDTGSQGHVGPRVSDGLTVDPAPEPGTPCVSQVLRRGPERPEAMRARGAGRGRGGSLVFFECPGSGRGCLRVTLRGAAKVGPLFTWRRCVRASEAGAAQPRLCAEPRLWSRTRLPVWSSGTGGVTAQNPGSRLGRSGGVPPGPQPPLPDHEGSARQGGRPGACAVRGRWFGGEGRGVWVHPGASPRRRGNGPRPLRGARLGLPHGSCSALPAGLTGLTLRTDSGGLTAADSLRRANIGSRLRQEADLPPGGGGGGDLASL